MHAKTMEGLIGANTNMKLMNTPFRVYKEASQRGDTATMERAMGYTNECSDQAKEYIKKAEKGMKEDAKEAKKNAELELENAIQKCKEDHKELEKRIEESQNEKTDTVEISTGKSEETKVNSVETDPVIYTKTGEVPQNQSESNGSISVSV